jgi:hypothetical protein
METTPTFTAFAGDRRIASGELRTMLLEAKRRLDGGEEALVLVFDDQSGKQVDFDFHGSPEEVIEREAPSPRPGPGRPKLGVVGREVSLLPRHWEWLESQPQGISAALRRLIDEARKRAPAKERARLARDAAGKIMWALAGNLPGFEEASRALYAVEAKRFRSLVRPWPKDVRDYILRIAEPSFATESPEEGGA